MFEAAKDRLYPQIFETEEQARVFIAGAAADEVRPWIRRMDVKPMIDSFTVVGGRDVPARGALT